MTRRDLLAAIMCGALPVACPMAARAAGHGQDAGAFVQATANRMTAIIDSDDAPAAKAAKLQAAVDQSVDSEDIARFCLGRFWRLASTEQQKSFLAMFHRVLLDGVTGQISAYKGVKVTTGAAREHEDGTVVPSIVARPGQKEVRVDWLVRPTPAGLRIEDVVAEGTSLRLTRRNDYAAYLAAHGSDVGALLDAMRQKLAQQ